LIVSDLLQCVKKLFVDGDTFFQIIGQGHDQSAAWFEDAIDRGESRTVQRNMCISFLFELRLGWMTAEHRPEIAFTDNDICTLITERFVNLAGIIRKKLGTRRELFAMMLEEPSDI